VGWPTFPASFVDVEIGIGLPTLRDFCRVGSIGAAISLAKATAHCPRPLECFVPQRYLPFTSEQWVEAVFHVPESFTHVSLQITVRSRCVPLSSASYVNV
jgi:hypothetical protein